MSIDTAVSASDVMGWEGRSMTAVSALEAGADVNIGHEGPTGWRWLDGVVSRRRWNARFMVSGVPNPHARAIFSIPVMAVSRRRHAASMRTDSICSAGVMPTAVVNTRLDWRSERCVRAAIAGIGRFAVRLSGIPRSRSRMGSSSADYAASSAEN